MIGMLVSGVLPTELIFIIAFSIALPINHSTVAMQMEQLKKHAPSALMMTTVIIAAGIFLGILNGTGMLNALAQTTVTLLPATIIPYLHIIVGFLVHLLS